MASIGLINLGILPLLLEAMTPAYAQHDLQEQDSRRQQQEQEPKAKKNQSSRPERERKPQSEARPQGQLRSERPDRQENPHPRREARPEAQPPQDRTTRREAQQRPGREPERQSERQPPPARRAGSGQPPSAQVPRPRPHTPQTRNGQHQSAWPAHRARDWKAEHRTWQDRGGYRGYRIPDARFRGSFGPSHGFRMHRFPLIVIDGFPRFQFNGLWFSVMDPWPEYWSENWYGDDDLYIEQWDDGYYLFNRRHPMDRIAITVLVG